MPHEMNEEAHACCGDEGHGAKRPWYKSALFLMVLAILALFASSFFFPFLAPFRRSFAEYLRMVGAPIGIGLLLGGLVDYYVPQEYISKYLARKSRRTIFYSVGLGLLMSACSHGIIALSMELHKKGASGPAVVSFLLASPWANLPVTFLLIGFFGWKGFLIIFAALLVAVNTGLVFQLLERKRWIEINKHSVEVDPDFSIGQDVMKRIREYRWTPERLSGDITGVGRGIYDLAKMILGWILAGILLASLASAFVPTHIFRQFLGPTWPGLLVTIGVATVLEVCSEGTSPLAFEIYRQTRAFGNAFAFLMGGVVTDYTEIGIVWANLGKKTALWMMAVALPQVLLLGYIFNAIF